MFLTILLIGNSLYAQTLSELPEYEGEIYLGYGIGYTGGLSWSGGIVKTPDWGRLSLRITALDPDSEEDEMSSFDLMIGRTFKMQKILASVSGGVGMIQGEPFDLGVPGFAFGFPLELQFSQMPFATYNYNFAFGLNIFGNINEYSPMLGITLICKMVR